MQTLRKTTWMLYSYIGKLAISLLFLCIFSCTRTDIGDVVHQLKTYKNQSSYDIEIVTYFIGGTEERNYFIKNSDELRQTTELFAIADTDSVQIIFDPDDSPKIAKFINTKYLGGQTSNINDKSMFII